MKTKILMFVALMSISAVLVAQPGENGQKKQFHSQGKQIRVNDEHRGPAEGLNLSDAQKEAFKQSKIAMQKDLKPLRNELGEVEAHQKTLVSAEKPDLKAIDKNLDKIGELKTEMAKIQVKHRLEMRAQLTEEQQMKFDMLKHKMKHGKGDWAMNRGSDMNHQKGMRHEPKMN